MLKANINGTRYPLPESLGDLTLSQFIELKTGNLFIDRDTLQFTKQFIP